MSAEGIQVSLITSDGGPVGKRYELDDFGELVKNTALALAHGTVANVAVDGLTGLRDLIAGTEPNQTLSFGRMKDDRASAKLVLQRHLEAHPDAIARDRNHFEFAIGAPAFWLFDFDGHHTQHEIAGIESAKDALAHIASALGEAPMLWRASSGAYIVNADTAEELTGLSGQHVYVPVTDGSDIARAGKALIDRAWLAGYGRYEVSESGQLLQRAVVDGSVWQPERLVFVAEPDFQPPLKRAAPDMQLSGDSSALFNTRLVKDLDERERRQLARIKATERARVEPEAKIKRDAFIIAAGERHAKSNGRDKDASVAMFRDAIEHSNLSPQFVLYTADGKPVTVGQILADPNTWHGRRFRDPLEPNYREDPRIARLNARTGGKICLYSHAHGGRSFYLQRERAAIPIVGGEMAKATTDALGVIREHGEIFEHGVRSLVRTIEGRTEPITSIYLQDYLGQVCRFERYSKQDEKMRAIDTPPKVADFILERHGQRELPTLEAVVTAPILRPDGSVLDAPGYDEASHLLFYSPAIDTPRIPLAPTFEQAERALAKLWQPFAEFSFVDDVARGVMLAAILTAVLRPALSTAPAFAFDAPSIGSGKTLLARTLAAFAGVVFDAKSPPDNDEEMRKYLFSCLRIGARVICLDNFTGPIDGAKSAALCAFLTSPIFQDRVLGVSEVESLPNRALVLFTGNNLRIEGDMVRRVLTSRIDVRVEAPYARRFKFDPERMVRNDRLGFVGAALTLIRAAITHGGTLDTGGNERPLDGSTASYEGWDSLVRQTVGWASQWLRGPVTFGDPTADIQQAASTDPRIDTLRDVLRAWRLCFGDQPKTCREAWHHSSGHDDLGDPGNGHGALRAAFGEISGGDPRFNEMSLGRWLAKHRDQLVSGLRFERRQDREKKNAWRAVQV